MVEHSLSGYIEPNNLNELSFELSLVVSRYLLRRSLFGKKLESNRFCETFCNLEG